MLSVAFWMKQGFIERACQSMLGSGATSDHFVEGIVEPAVTKGRLADLTAIIEQGDRGMWKEHVIAAAKFLHSKTLFSAAYHFQV